MEVTLFTDKDFKAATSPELAFMTDVYSIGAMLHLAPKTLTNALVNKEKMTVRHLIKKPGGGVRATYETYKDSSLRRVQTRLHMLLKSLYTEEHSHILSYRKGVDARSVVAHECARSKYVVHVDIKKYYDYTTFKHIKNVFIQMGAPESGAKTLAKYFCVKRDVNGKTFFTNQQGSCCAPDMANFVLHYEADIHIKKWLAEQQEKYPKMTWKYLRYSDNLALFLDGEIPMGFINEYKEMLYTLLKSKGFLPHKWCVTPRNHPKRHQEFLGVVLNDQGRIDTRKFKRVRGALFNAASKGLSSAAFHFQSTVEQGASCLDDHPYGGPRREEKFLQWASGCVASLKNISKKQYLELSKLLMAAKIEQELQISLPSWNSRLPEEVFEAVKKYGDAKEDVNTYLTRIREAWGHKSQIAA